MQYRAVSGVEILRYHLEIRVEMEGRKTVQKTVRRKNRRDRKQFVQNMKRYINEETAVYVIGAAAIVAASGKLYEVYSGKTNDNPIVRVAKETIDDLILNESE